MKQVIFKNAKKAKAYEIRSAKKQGVFCENKLIYKVFTDDVNELMKNDQHQVFAVEINNHL